MRYVLLCFLLISSVTFSQEINKTDSKPWILNQLLSQGLSAQKEGKHERAIKDFTTALKIPELKNIYPKEYADFLEGYAVSSLTLGKTKGLLKKYKEVLNIRERLNDARKLSSTHLNISNYYLKTKNYSLANKHAKKAFDYAVNLEDIDFKLKVLESVLNFNLNKELKEYFKKYINLKEELIKKNNEVVNKANRYNYLNTVKEKENSILQTEKLNIQKEVSNQKKKGLYIVLVSFLIIVIIVVFWILQRKKMLYRNLLNEARVKYQERDRISKELHDGVLSKLFGIRFNLGFFAIKGDLMELNKYQYYLNELQFIEKEIREVSHKLSYNVSQKFDLLLNELLEEKSNIGGFKYKSRISSEVLWEEVDEKIKINIYRIFQELLHNIVKHSKANFVELLINLEDNSLIMKVRDNGIGIEKDKQEKGIGILNIKSRVKKINGSFQLESKDKKGVSIFIKIPLKSDFKASLLQK